MTWQATQRVMELSQARGITRLVLVTMANRAGGDHDECFASVERIAHDARVSPRTVQRAITELVRLGDLVAEGVHPKYRTNVYMVMPRRVSESHPPVTSGPDLTPELKEVEVRGSSKGSPSGSTNGSAPTFEEAWKAYPSEGRRAKPKARERWKAAVKKAPPEVILAGIVAYRDDPGRDPSHTKWMQGWLADERWNDPPLPSRNGQRESAFDRAAREAMADAY